MALKKTVVAPDGTTMTNAYHRISFIRLDGKTGVVFVVSSCKDSNSPAFNELQRVGPYNLNDGNPLAQAYVHLKTTPEFVGAEDC